jgi:hypothetical protein
MSVGVTGLALALVGAEPSRAGDEFEDGFKDELGRIAAHEAVRGGRQILASILLGGGPVAAPVVYRDEPVYPQAYPEPYPVERYGRAVYHEVRHDHYHHYPVAYGYYGRDDDSDSDSDHRHWRHKRHHERHHHHGGCRH